MQALIQKIIQIVKGLILNWLAGMNPKVAEYVKLAYVLAVDIVQAAEDSGASGPEKKAKAVADLKAAMVSHGLHLPGDLEEHVAGAVVEGAVLALKEHGGSFFAGLGPLLEAL